MINKYCKTEFGLWLQKHDKALQNTSAPRLLQTCLKVDYVYLVQNHKSKSCRADYHDPSMVLEIQHSPNRQCVILTAKAGGMNERPACLA